MANAPQQTAPPSSPSSAASKATGGIDWRSFVPGLAAGLFLGLVIGVLAPTILSTPSIAPTDAGNYRPPAGIAPEAPADEDTNNDTSATHATDNQPR